MNISKFVNIDISKEPQNLKMWLAKPDKTIVAVLHTTAYNIQSQLKLSNVCELNFSIPLYVNINGKYVKNPVVDMTKERFLIKTMNGDVEMWYTIHKISDSDQGNDESRVVNAYSLEYELKDKTVRSFQYDSLNISQCLEGGTITLNGTTQNVPNLLSSTIWNVGYVDADFSTRFRSMDISSTTLLDYIFQVATTFDALVEFDEVNKQINFYNPLNQGIDRGLSISYGNYMQTVSNESDTEEMATRLKVFGKDDLSIDSVNPTGQNYLEDLSYFIFPYQEDSVGNVVQHSYYMSDSLCHAELAYMKKVQSYQGQMTTLVKQLSDQQAVLTEQQDQLSVYTTEINVLKDTLAQEKAQQADTSTTQSQINSKQSQIDSQNATISQTNSDINNTQNQIQSIGTALSIENNFTVDQITERNLYIIEKEWSDSNYTDPQQLYDDAVKQFNYIKQPKTTVSIDLVNFLQIVQCQRDWDKLNLGDFVTIKHERLGMLIKAKIIEANIDYEKGTIQLVVANTKDISNDGQKLAKLLNNVSYSSTTVDMSKYKWNIGQTAYSQVEQVINNTWDATKRAIIAGANQQVTIDQRGIMITDPNNPLNFLVANAGVLAITNDGGNTWKNAITANGIVGERVFGKLIAGVNLIIDSSDSTGTKTFIVDSTGVKIYGNSLTVVKGNNGVAIDPTNGITVTNGANQITLNASVGITIAKNSGTMQSPSWSNVFYVDTEGNLHLTGTVDATAFSINGKNVLDSSGLFINGAVIQNLTVTNAKIIDLDVDKINAGTIDTSKLHIHTPLSNGGYIDLDATSGFTANDGTRNTVKIGMDGTAYFAGNVTSDAIITGATFRTADVGHDRIEISGGSFKGITSSELLTGLVFDIGTIAGSGIADIGFYHNGTKLAEFYDGIDYFSLRPTTDSRFLGIGDPTSSIPVRAEGNWLFPNGFKLPNDTDVTKFEALISGTGATSYPIFKFGTGNGTGDNGKGIIYKDSSTFVVEYIQTNGNIQSITFNDSGTTTISHPSGSSIIFDSNGDVTVHAQGNLNLTGSTINLN